MDNEVKWYKPVTQRHEKVIIVAGGSSLKGFDLKKLENLKGVATIAVNEALCCFKADYFVTIDPNPIRSLLIAKEHEHTYKFVGFKEPVENAHMLLRWKPTDGEDYRLREEKDEIQTTNSGYAAFNLAYHFEAKKVLLLGIDADDQKHFYNDVSYPIGSVGYEKSLNLIPACFEAALPQIKQRGIYVVNGSMRSRVDCFPKMTPDDGIDWLLR